MLSPKSSKTSTMFRIFLGVLFALASTTTFFGSRRLLTTLDLVVRPYDVAMYTASNILPWKYNPSDGTDDLPRPVSAASSIEESDGAISDAPRFLRPRYFRHPSVPPPDLPVPAPGDVFSACLLLKDDNDILSEWLAYHYVALPLRHLVVAVDPHSATSPEPILRRWGYGRGPAPGRPHVNIELWDDADVFPDRSPEERLAFQNVTGYSKDALIEQHKKRQMRMMSRCMRRHKEEGRTWVILADSDEYLVVNPADAGDRPQKKKHWGTRPATPEEVARENWWTRKFDAQREARGRLPPAGGGATVADFVLAERDRHPWKYDDEPCLSVPRLFYGAIESEVEAVREAVPEELRAGGGAEAVAQGLNTIRYRHHAGKFHNKFNLLGKSLVDVSRVSEQDLNNVSDNTHKPIKDICLRAYSRWDTALLRFNHYLGGWDKHGKRDDVRRSKEHYDWKANIDQGEDDVIRPWLKRFYDMFGKEVFVEYLQLSHVFNATDPYSVEE